MPWRKYFRIFSLVGLGGLLLLSVFVALGYYWAEIDRKAWRLSPEARIARELGWSEAANDEAVRARISRQPQPVLPLLTHRSLEIRKAARRCLNRVPLDEPSLGFLFAELGDPATATTTYAGDIVYLLCQQPDDGAALFSFFYKSADPVPPVVQNELEFQASRPFPPETWPKLLLALVRDPAVPAPNRCAVLKIWDEMYLAYDRREMGDPLVYPPHVTELEALVPDMPPPVADAARETIRRFQRVRTFQSDWPQMEIDRETILSHQPPAAFAIAALENDKNWELTHQAALQLALNGNVDALPALRVAADTHWYPQVRETARLAVDVLEGRHPELLQNGGEPLLQRIDARARERLEAWRAQRPPPPSQTSPGTFKLIVDAFVIPWMKRVYYEAEPLMAAWSRRLQSHRELEVEYRWKKSAPPLRFNWDLRPRHTLRFAGGKLLGYSDHHGAGTIFIFEDEAPRLLDPSHVEGFARMPFGTVIFCTDYDPISAWANRLLLLRDQGEGQVTVEPFKRLPYGDVRFQKSWTGELLIDCGMDKVVITTEGGIRMANEQEEKTWRD
jgi:hypothetical protein